MTSGSINFDKYGLAIFSIKVLLSAFWACYCISKYLSLLLYRTVITYLLPEEKNGEYNCYKTILGIFLFQQLTWHLDYSCWKVFIKIKVYKMFQINVFSQLVSKKKLGPLWCPTLDRNLENLLSYSNEQKKTGICR